MSWEAQYVAFKEAYGYWKELRQWINDVERCDENGNAICDDHRGEIIKLIRYDRENTSPFSEF